MLNTAKGHISVQNVDGVMVLVSCIYQVVLSICTQLRENISNDFRIMKQKPFPY